MRHQPGIAARADEEGAGSETDRLSSIRRRGTTARRRLSAQPGVPACTALAHRTPRVTATQTTRDAIASVQFALNTAASLLGRPLIDDLTDPATGEITPIFLVTGPAAGRCCASSTSASG